MDEINTEAVAQLAASLMQCEDDLYCPLATALYTLHPTIFNPLADRMRTLYKESEVTP